MKPDPSDPNGTDLVNIRRELQIKAVDSDFLTQKDPVYNDYEVQLVAISAKKAIQLALSQKMTEQADIASRLLVDLSDGRLSPAEGQQILDTLHLDFADKQAHLWSSKSKQRITIILSLFVSLIVGITTILFVYLNGQHGRPALEKVALSYQYLPANKESALRSLTGQYRSTFQIDNQSQKAVNLYWLDYDGKRSFCERLDPGESAGQNTFATHPFVVLDDENQVKLLFVVSSKPFERIVLK